MNHNISYTMHGVTTIQTGALNRFPDKCPLCNIGMAPYFLTASRKGNKLQAIFRCPLINCNEIFMAYYQWDKEKSNQTGLHDYFSFQHRLVPNNNKGRTFEDEITQLSPRFQEIYNQAEIAENSRLYLICGMGYRKALEFLIKDYLINYKALDKEKIQKKYLGKCIEDDIDNTKIKGMAKRATWLGNDETHYTRQHDDMDLDDLKKLLDITLHWISMELLTAQYEKDLPEPHR